MKWTARAVGVLALVLVVVPACLEAATLKIWPQDLRNARQQFPGNGTVLQIPDGTMAMDEPSLEHYFAWAPIILPVGARISKVTCYYRALSATGAELMCYVYRRAWGKTHEDIYHVIVGGASNEYTPHDLGWFGGDQTVHAGYVHYLLVLVKKPASFGGLKITYTAP
jgi:hypothetical protein